MTSVAIIVLNWNGIDDTLECIDSLLLQSYKNKSIIIIDNGSTDGSVNVLKTIEKTKNITVLYNQENLGFAGGVNIGINYAINNEFKYIALFNNDAVADPRWLEYLVKAQSATTGITTGLLLHRDGKTIDSSGDWYSTWGLSFPRNRNEQTRAAAPAGFVFSASGGASLYKSELFSDIGLFDEKYFAYYEDVDVSFRAQLAGWNVYYTPSAIAYHKQGATSSKLGGFTVVQTFKNLPLLFIKNVPRALLVPIGIRFYLSYLLIFINAIAKGSGLSACKGIIQSLLLTPYALRLRFNIQRNKRVSADAIKTLLWNDLPPDQIGIRKFRRIFTGKS